MTSTERRAEPGGGARPTRQRLAVLDALVTAGDFRSAREVHALLAERGDPVGLATVYRAVQLLAEAGEVDVLRNEAGETNETRYRRCSTTHHHHLVCRACGATVEIEGPTVERWTEAVADELGFVDVSHTLEIFGTCTACRAS